jgi:PAS domain-containing protein
MRATQFVEQAEQSADWLLSVAAEAVLLVDVATGSIVEANPAAAALLKSRRTFLLGTRLSDAFGAQCTTTIDHSFATACISGSAQPLIVSTRDTTASLKLTLSLVRTRNASHILARLASASTEHAPSQRGPSLVENLLSSTSDGFVLTDPGFRVEFANPAFMQLARLASAASVEGRSLSQWLEFSTEDLEGLQQQLKERQALTTLRTTLRCGRGSALDVEVHAVAVPDGPNAGWGFIVREAFAQQSHAPIIPAGDSSSSH